MITFTPALPHMNLIRRIVVALAILFCLGETPFNEAHAADAPAAEKPAEAKPPAAKPAAETPAAAAQPATPPAPANPPAAPAAKPATPPAPANPPAAPVAKPATPPAVAKPAAKPDAKPVKQPKAKEKKEPRLRFNFRFQAWADVLDWFAKQADLALVLDAPVPGTFNYTDTNEYTPTEAIDLLNGVLLTKGYTLIRRDRMLMVVNLQDGIPEGMVPRVTVEDLSKRGRFEIVSVLLPLNNRNVEEVNKEITPLLGPYGKSVPLAKTGQLLVTDTAGILQAVDAMIKSMPEQAKPPAQPKPPAQAKPAPPALVVYPVKSADPQVAVEVLKALLPEAKIVLDPKAAQINVFAVPDHQAVAKSVIEQMQANNPPEKMPRLEVYNLKKDAVGKRTKQIVNTLQVIAPDARITSDIKTGKLVVWATPEQHAMIIATLEKLHEGSSPADTVQIEVHRLTTVEPENALALLKKLMPDAQFAVDANSRSLIAIALPEEQAAIRTTLAELQGDTSKSAGDRRLKSYRLSKPAAPTLVNGLRILAPAAQISIDPGGQLLTVVASETDQKAIEAAVTQIEEPVANRQLEVYPLDDLTPDSTMQLLRTLVPRTELSFDAQTQNLVVLGTAADQKTIQATLKQLRTEQQTSGDAQLLFYPLKQAPPPTLITGLSQLVPKATITLEAGGKRLMVVAKAADHAKIAAILKRLAENVPSQTLRFEVYAIGGTQAASLLSTLQPLVPEAKLSVDPKTNRLLVWANEADHNVLKTAVGRLEKGRLGQDSRKMEIHKLKKADPQTVLSLMQTIVPEATLSIDVPTRSLAALATPAEQETIRRALERLESSHYDDSPVLRFHELLQTPPANLVTGLAQMFPEAKITLDGKRLMIIADEELQNRIKAAIMRIEDTIPIAEPKKLATYSVTPAEKARFTAIIPTLTVEMPGISMVTDSEPGVLTIWATPTQHVLLADIIKQLKLDVPEDRKHSFVGYTIANADPAVVLQTLTGLLPNAKLSVDPRAKRLLAWCSSEDHEKIKQALEQMDSGKPEDARDQLMVYPIQDTDPTVAMKVLAQTLPDVTFHSDTTAGTIIARARKSDHKLIAETLKALQASEDSGQKQVLEVYPTGESDPATVVSSLTGIVPKAKLVADPSRGRISAWASSKDQATIRQAVEKLAKAEDAKTAPTVATYRLGRLKSASTIKMLRSIVPQAQIAVGADLRQIIVWARPSDQQRIKQTFERMKTNGTDEDQAKVVVYPLESTPSATATQVIAQAAPDAIVAPGSDPSQLVVWALADEHDKIKTVLDQLAEGNPPTELKTYTLESVTSTIAIPVITQTAPQATINPGSDPQQLIIRARPAEHAKIA
ncbi:MAG: hypothetical protein JXM70_25955, partial [Pirellulales bacterium]|nr:hypothetical protein [Pirellulales bacterium]